MKKIYLIVMSIVVLASLEAISATVTVTLVDGNNVVLANYPPSASEMTYQYRCGGSWVYGGNVQTDALGQFATSDITCENWDGKITVVLHQKSREEVVTGDAVTFEAARVNVNLKNPCTGLITETPGGIVRQGGGHWYVHGTTAGTGVLTFYTFPGNVKLQMIYNWKGITQYPVAISAGTNDVDFLTTNVNIVSSEPVQYQTGGWPTVTFPIELLQGDHNLRIEGSIKTITASGCSFTGGLITLVDEAGDALANYPADYPGETRNLKYRYRCGGSWAPWTSFQTDANGQTFYSINCASNNWDNQITMALNQRSTQQDVTVHSTFHAARVNVNLKNPCTGLITESPGGTVRQGGGYWYTHGTTAGTGTVTFYTFPGNVKLYMKYNWKGITQTPVAIAAGTNEVDFLTTNVNIVSDGPVQYQTSGWPTVTFPIELLQGDHNLRIDGTIKTITVSGCSLTGGLITLVDEAGDALANYPADYPGESRNLKYRYRCGGSWAPYTSFQTDANGQTFYSIDCASNNWDNKITLVLNQKSTEQDMTMHSTFHAAKVNVNLKNPCTGLIPESPGGAVRQGGGYWYTHGTTAGTGTVTFYTFPGNVKLYMKYNWKGITQTPVAIAAGTNEVDFLTTNVNIISDGLVKYKTSGWPTVIFPIELLQGSHQLRIDGTVKTITASGCAFSGGFLTLVDEAGNPLVNYPADYPAQPSNLRYRYRCGGSWGIAWTPFQTDGNGQFFFSVDCINNNWDSKILIALNQKSTEQVVTENSIFQAARVNVNLIDCDGLITDEPGGTVRQGGGYWYTHGMTGPSGTVTLYTFPTGDIKIRMVYNSNSEIRDGIAIVAGTNEVDFNFEDCNPERVSVENDNSILQFNYSPTQISDVDGSIEKADSYIVDNNYPNPFNQFTMIEYTLHVDSKVSVIIYDVTGKQVKILVDGMKYRGDHQIEWDGRNDSGQSLTGGMYFYRLRVGDAIVTKSMIKVD